MNAATDDNDEEPVLTNLFAHCKSAAMRSEWTSSALFSLGFLWLSELLRPSGGPRASSAAVAVWTDCTVGSHARLTQTHTCINTRKTPCHVLKLRTHSLSPLFHPTLTGFPAPLSFSLSPPSTSSCVRQLRNISRSRQAINIVCPPKIVRIII